MSKLEDPEFLPYLLRFHFVCLIETFVAYFEDSCVSSSFRVFVSAAQKLSHKGRRSGGIICLVSHSISAWVRQVDCCYDNVLVFRFCGHLFNSDRDVLLVSVYVPPTGSPYYDNLSCNNGINTLEECILQLCEQHDDCFLIVCGDLNARTGNCNTGNQDDYMNMRRDFSEFRCSEDSVINEFGRSLLSLCSGFDLQILNGTVEGDRHGCFTYISPSGNSVIDYVLVSRDFARFCTSLLVKENVLSTHLCLELEVESTVNGHSKRRDCNLHSSKQRRAGLGCRPF